MGAQRSESWCETTRQRRASRDSGDKHDKTSESRKRRLQVRKLKADREIVLDAEFESSLTAAQSGAEWAWSLLYHSVARQVLGYLRAQGAREPEDLLGEVFLQVARGIAGFSGTEEGFRSWVFTIAHNRVIDERRHRRRHPVDPVEVVTDKATPAQSSAEHALEILATERVRGLVDQLAPAQRDVMMLRIVAGMTVAEVANVLGRSVGGVKALQRRAVASLRRLIDEKGVSL